MSEAGGDLDPSAVETVRQAPDVAYSAFAVHLEGDRVVGSFDGRRRLSSRRGIVRVAARTGRCEPQADVAAEGCAASARPAGPSR